MSRHALWLVLPALLVALSARADDPKADALTVLPWTAATVGFTSKDKRATLQYSQLLGRRWSLFIKASAPLDEDTRLAAFTDSNALTKGFEGMAQLGIDSRAEQAALLMERVEHLGEAYDHLSDLSDLVASGAQATFAQAKSLPNASDGEVLKYLCNQAGLGAVCGKGADAVEPTFEWVCASQLGGRRNRCSIKSPEGFLAAATTFVEKSCASGPATSDACFTAAWSIGVLHNMHLVEQLNLDPDFVDAIWHALESADPKKAATLVAASGRTAAAIAQNAADFADALKAVVMAAPLERRDLLLMGTPGTRRYAYAVAVDLSGSYDKLSVYQGDVSPKPKDSEQYSLEIGVNYTAYLPLPGLSINARAGFDRSQSAKAKAFERCVQLTSSDATVGGKQCDSKALFRTSDAPPPENTVYARVAIDYQYGGTPAADTLIPGVELRAGLEGFPLGTRSLAMRLSLFGTPVKGSAAARVGVGINAQYLFDVAANDPHWVVTPLVFVGGTLTDLLGKTL